MVAAVARMEAVAVGGGDVGESWFSGAELAMRRVRWWTEETMEVASGGRERVSAREDKSKSRG